MHSKYHYSAVGLPQNKLSKFIEDRVNGYLEKQGAEEAGDVVIRVLSSADKEVEVKGGMRSRLVSRCNVHN